MAVGNRSGRSFVSALGEPFADGWYAEAGGMAINARYRHRL
jgi:hypothetical protein